MDFIGFKRATDLIFIAKNSGGQPGKVNYDDKTDTMSLSYVLEDEGYELAEKAGVIVLTCVSGRDIGMSAEIARTESAS